MADPYIDVVSSEDSTSQPAIQRNDARRSPAAEWVRTLVICCLLIGGLVAILPMIPDRENGSSFKDESKPEQTGMLTIPAVMTASMAPLQATDIVRGVRADHHHKT